MPPTPRGNPKQKAARRLYGVKPVDDLARVAASGSYSRLKEPYVKPSLG